jgi:hypothetical protein
MFGTTNPPPSLLSIGVLEDFPANKLPGFADALLERLPGLMNHTRSRAAQGFGMDDVPPEAR